MNEKGRYLRRLRLLIAGEDYEIDEAVLNTLAEYYVSTGLSYEDWSRDLNARYETVAVQTGAQYAVLLWCQNYK